MKIKTQQLWTVKCCKANYEVLRFSCSGMEIGDLNPHRVNILTVDNISDL